MSAVNPRYVAYARAHGKTPEDMMAFDTDRYPGGKMCGFLVWMGEQWAEFMRTQCPKTLRNGDRDVWRGESAADGGRFDQWQAEMIP